VYDRTMKSSGLNTILSVQQLGIRRSERWLIRDLSFDLSAGEILQVVGRNGAGKTSLLRSLCGLLSNVEGVIHWQEKDSKIMMPLFIGHLPAVKMELSVMENLKYHPLNGIFIQTERINQAIEEVGLREYTYTAARYLSAGQVRRVALARLLLSDTNCWILDEPFTSLDVNGCKWLEDKMHDFIMNKGSVIVTSHQAMHLKSEPTIIELKENELLDYEYDDAEEILC